jgi:hypothetical protein
LPQNMRAARRSALPIALMFLLTMAVPGDAAIVQNGTVLCLQPALNRLRQLLSRWGALCAVVSASRATCKVQSANCKVQSANNARRGLSHSLSPPSSSCSSRTTPPFIASQPQPP